MEITTSYTVLFLLSVIWMGLRMQMKQNGHSTQLVESESETPSINPVSTVTMKLAKKTQKRNRFLRRRMAWARRRLVMYPDQCKKVTKARAFRFVAKMLVNGPKHLRLQALSILKEIVATHSEHNSVYMHLHARRLLAIHDPKWLSKHTMNTEQVLENMGNMGFETPQRRLADPEEMAEAA